METLQCTDAPAGTDDDVCLNVCACCSHIFPNQEMDQLATALRQVARMLWGIHVILQTGFEHEVRATLITISQNWPVMN